MHPKKVLITGASGYIGRHVVKEFLDMGYSVIANDFSYKGVDERAEYSDAAIFNGNKHIYSELQEPDILLHLAWRDGFIHNSSAHMHDLSAHMTFLQNMIDGGLVSQLPNVERLSKQASEFVYVKDILLYHRMNSENQTVKLLKTSNARYNDEFAIFAGFGPGSLPG